MGEMWASESVIICNLQREHKPYEFLKRETTNHKTKECGFNLGLFM